MTLTMMGQPWTEPHPAQDYLVVHTSYPLFKLKPNGSTLKMDFGCDQTSLFVPLPNVVILDKSSLSLLFTSILPCNWLFGDSGPGQAC